MITYFHLPRPILIFQYYTFSGGNIEKLGSMLQVLSACNIEKTGMGLGTRLYTITDKPFSWGVGGRGGRNFHPASPSR